jgi:hypothetical protein
MRKEDATVAIARRAPVGVPARPGAAHPPRSELDERPLDRFAVPVDELDHERQVTVELDRLARLVIEVGELDPMVQPRRAHEHPMPPTGPHRDVSVAVRDEPGHNVRHFLIGVLDPDAPREPVALHAAVDVEHLCAGDRRPVGRAHDVQSMSGARRIALRKEVRDLNDQRRQRDPDVDCARRHRSAPRTNHRRGTDRRDVVVRRELPVTPRRAAAGPASRSVDRRRSAGGGTRSGRSSRATRCAA